MSMIRCDRCETIFDSDGDPDCFVEVPWLNIANRVWCDLCRDAFKAAIAKAEGK